MSRREVIAVFHSPDLDDWKPLIALLPTPAMVHQVCSRLNIPETEIEYEKLPVSGTDLGLETPLHFVAALWPNIPTIPFVTTDAKEASCWRLNHGPSRSGAALEDLTIHERQLGWIADEIPNLRENFLY